MSAKKAKRNKEESLLISYNSAEDRGGVGRSSESDDNVQPLDLPPTRLRRPRSRYYSIYHLSLCIKYQIQEYSAQLTGLQRRSTELLTVFATHRRLRIQLARFFFKSYQILSHIYSSLVHVSNPSFKGFFSNKVLRQVLFLLQLHVDGTLM